MNGRLLALGMGVVVLTSAWVWAQPHKPMWPRSLASCPAFVHLKPGKLDSIDGRRKRTLRLRPWPDKQGRTRHIDLVIENQRLHHFHNQKAIMVNTGSADKPRVNGRIASYRSVVFRNLDIGPVYRTEAGLHMDHIWIGAGHDDAFRPDVTFERIFIHDSNDGVMPVLFEAGGNWGTVTFRRVALANVRHPIMIKLGKSRFKSIIIENCPGVRISLQGDPSSPVTIRVRNSPGADIQCPKDAQGRRATDVTVVSE